MKAATIEFRIRKMYDSAHVCVDTISDNGLLMISSFHALEGVNPDDFTEKVLLSLPVDLFRKIASEVDSDIELSNRVRDTYNEDIGSEEITG